LLGSLSGAGNASSPSQAIGAATTAGSTSFNELGSLLASLGYTAKGGGIGGWGSSGGGNNPNLSAAWSSGGTPINFDGSTTNN
jgi:hypothetical protein